MRNRSKIDLVLLDLTMPEQSGLEIYRALRGLDPRARVVLTSGFGLEYGGDSFPPPGISGFLPKPHGLSNLRAAMVHALSSSNAS